MRHDIESCDQGGEDQDKTWLDGPVASMKGKSDGATGALYRKDRVSHSAPDAGHAVTGCWGPTSGQWQQ